MYDLNDMWDALMWFLAEGHVPDECLEVWETMLQNQDLESTRTALMVMHHYVFDLGPAWFQEPVASVKWAAEAAYGALFNLQAASNTGLTDHDRGVCEEASAEEIQQCIAHAMTLGHEGGA